MGANVSHDLDFTPSDDAEWLSVAPLDLYVPKRSIAFIKLRRGTGAGTQQICIRLVDNSSGSDGGADGTDETTAIDTLVSRDMAPIEATAFMERFVGYFPAQPRRKKAARAE